MKPRCVYCLESISSTTRYLRILCTKGENYCSPECLQASGNIRQILQENRCIGCDFAFRSRPVDGVFCTKTCRTAFSEPGLKVLAEEVVNRVVDSDTFQQLVASKKLMYFYQVKGAPELCSSCA